VEAAEATVVGILGVGLPAEAVVEELGWAVRAAEGMEEAAMVAEAMVL
jgi:hypothetical protein